MKTDMEKMQENGWEDGGDMVKKPRIRKRVTKKTVMDYKPLIIVGASALLVVILIFSAGRGWQSRVDKKQIDRLNESNSSLQTQIQDLQKSNKELQNQIASLETQTNKNTKNVTTAEGTKHQLQTAYNFREEASVDSEILAELDEGTTVTIIKVVEDGWVQVKYNNQTGYLKCADELSDTAASGTTAGTSAASGTTSSGEDEDA